MRSHSSLAAVLLVCCRKSDSRKCGKGQSSMIERLLQHASVSAGRAISSGPAREDRAVVVLIVIAVAVVLVMGLVAAWFMYCQSRGMWPAMDMPSFSSGGTWKVYCKR